MNSSPLRAAAAVSALSVLLVLAAGCGGKDDSASDKNGDSAASAAFLKKSGDEIADAAKTDMKTLDTVKFSGEINSDGKSIKLDIQASSSGDCQGTIGIGDGTAQVAAKDGTSWFKPDAAFWKANAGDSADAIIQAVGDKWVLDTDSNFSQFCDLDSFFDSVFKKQDDASEYKVNGTDEIDGKKVVKVDQTDKDGTATGYVLLDGKHYLVKIERTAGDQPGAVEFTDFNKEFTVDAPSADEVIDLSQVK
jgi:hypothetical protein